MSKHFTKSFNPLNWQAEPQDLTGNDTNFGIRAVETTQRYIYGTRHITWDGRVFKYSNAVAACYSYHGANAAEAGVVSYTANPLAGFAGDRHATITVASRSEDDLAGGYFVMFDNSGTDTTFCFGITGNDATSGTTTKVYLDGAIPVASTVSDYHELYENPYRELTEATDSYCAWMGVPAMTAAATYKFWCQTWGPAYISGGETIDTPAADSRTVVWGSNASLFKIATKVSGQIAGYILNNGSTTIPGPLIMLMCST